MLDQNESAPTTEPTLEELTWMVPYRVRLSRQLMRKYLETSDGRSQLLTAIGEPIRFLFLSTVPTSRDAEHYLGLISDILLHCDGTEVFDRALLASNLQKLSKHVTNPNIVGSNPILGGF